MDRFFNTTGTCIPGTHFMADISGKLEQIVKMVEQGNYFTINRPRQYGKTTTMNLLFQKLKTREDFLILDISFEGIGAPNYKKYELFFRSLLSLLKRKLKARGEEEPAKFLEENQNIEDFQQLSNLITELLTRTGKKTVLMIDEVDKSSNNQLFLDFLGMLRARYLAAKTDPEPTFHSVILAGVHDVRTLKAKLRPDEEIQYNSPWNIAVDFDVDLSLFPDEIKTMLQDYREEKKVKLDIPYFKEKLFYYTSGYPFLVSHLCKIIDEQLLPGKTKKEWTAQDLEAAVQIALKKDNTNFKSLIKNLQNNPELYEIVFKMVMNQGDFSFNPDNPLIDFGVVYGIFREDRGKTRIHNRIYEQRIYNYMASRLETSGDVDFYNITDSYLDAEGHLDMEKVCRKFREFMKEQYSTKDSSFIERNGRLLFLAFIKPIINGRGFDFKEVQVSEEKRLDIVITFANRKYVVELKIWRGETYHKKGIRQLADYLDRQNQTKGYLLIYDLRKESNQTGQSATISHSGKKIFTAWL